MTYICLLTADSASWALKPLIYASPAQFDNWRICLIWIWMFIQQVQKIGHPEAKSAE